MKMNKLHATALMKLTNNAKCNKQETKKLFRIIQFLLRSKQTKLLLFMNA